MNVVILMAGSDRQFKEQGYKYPRPLIEINDKPIVQHIVENIQPILDYADRVIFIVKKDDINKYYLDKTIGILAPGSCVVGIENDTAGAACTALLAIEKIEESSSLLILNGDQIIDENLLGIVHNFKKLKVDGGVIVFKSVHPRWSYVSRDKNGFVNEAAEKNPISNYATAGFYYYKTAADFIVYAKRMILKDSDVNGSFYVCPVYNEMILDQKKIFSKEIDIKKYHSFMTPEGIDSFKN
jgi:dTDP-glucose pyrophosphorylase